MVPGSTTAVITYVQMSFSMREEKTLYIYSLHFAHSVFMPILLLPASLLTAFLPLCPECVVVSAVTGPQTSTQVFTVASAKNITL